MTRWPLLVRESAGVRVAHRVAALFLAGLVLIPATSAFALDLPAAHALFISIPPAQAVIQSIYSDQGVPFWIAATSTADTSPSFLDNFNPVSIYLGALSTSPLPTKMMTGATLAVTGDAIAQAREPAPYDKQRAGSFAIFDMGYRALQHVAFPAIVNHCHGQYMATAASLLFSQYYLPLDFAASLERTLCSQLGIVPFIYYPAFFTITAYTQGLTVEAGINRAKKLFVPLMQRNLLFWLPIQYIQFTFVSEDLQIPFVSVCGLVWTCILSVLAGSSASATPEEEDETYCVVGSEEGCVVPEDLFPQTSLQDISEELAYEVQMVTEVISNELEEITSTIFDQKNDNDNKNILKGGDEKEDLTGRESEEAKEEVFK